MIEHAHQKTLRSSGLYQSSNQVISVSKKKKSLPWPSSGAGGTLAGRKAPHGMFSN